MSCGGRAYGSALRCAVQWCVCGRAASLPSVVRCVVSSSVVRVLHDAHCLNCAVIRSALVRGVYCGAVQRRGLCSGVCCAMPREVFSARQSTRHHSSAVCCVVRCGVACGALRCVCRLHAIICGGWGLGLGTWALAHLQWIWGGNEDLLGGLWKGGKDFSLWGAVHGLGLGWGTVPADLLSQ